MIGIDQIPDWLGETLLVALFAVLGFFARSFVDLLKAKRARADARQKALDRLAGLLRESQSIYLSQNYQARRLLKLLREAYPAGVPEGMGFDEAFVRFHNQFNDEQAELQALIRSTTMNSMQRVNAELRSWLKEHPEFLTTTTGDPALQLLSEQLRVLERHLNEWHDKYLAWMPSDERRSLVYLADEKDHGTGFPGRLHEALGTILKREI